jgi:hypothetical protein
VRFSPDFGEYTHHHPPRYMRHDLPHSSGHYIAYCRRRYGHTDRLRFDEESQP